MSSPLNLRVLNILVAIVAFTGLFIGLIKYSISAGSRLDYDSKIVLNEFYVRAKGRDYAGTHQLLSQNLKSTLSLQTLTQQWQAFEKAHGPIKDWKVAGTGNINLWPKHVESVHALTGQKNGAGTVWVRMVPENGTWRVGRLLIQP